MIILLLFQVCFSSSAARNAYLHLVFSLVTVWHDQFESEKQQNWRGTILTAFIGPYANSAV